MANPKTDGRLTVKLFASYADAFGSRALDIPISFPCTAREVVDLMRAMPGGTRLPVTPLVAVNRVWADLSSAIGSDDEVAVIPPVAGG